MVSQFVQERGIEVVVQVQGVVVVGDRWDRVWEGRFERYPAGFARSAGFARWGQWGKG